MDSLTHLLVGHAMGAVAVGAAPPYGAAAYWAVMIGNSLPDVDVPVSLILRRGIKLHRTFTHTIPGAAILAVLVAAGIQTAFPGTPFGVAFGWTFLGTLVHLGLDSLNLFGVRPFWPFSGRSLDLGVLHILDPFLILLLGLPTLAAAAGVLPVSAVGYAFFGIWPYVIHRVLTAGRIYQRLKQDSVRARVVPWFSSWRYIAETGCAIEVGRWNRCGRQPQATYLKHDSPLIRASLKNPRVAAFLATAEYPYAHIEEDEQGHAVVWGDALRQLRADFRPLRVRLEA